jgi:endo-1,4-beta-xylanase
MRKPILFLLVLLVCALPFSGGAEGTEPPAGGPEGAAGFAEENPDFNPEDLASSGMSASGAGLVTLTDEQFSVDDIPAEYLEESDRPGRVEKIRYTVATEEGNQVKIATVYLPYGYDTSGERYNVLYLLHAASGKPQNYLNPDSATAFRNLLDHMIADGKLEPLIVVAPTYYPSEGFMQYMPLTLQVAGIDGFPQELVEKVIPAVEQKYRTWADSTDIEAIVASRAHRGIAGFSLGGVATWNVFRQEMRCFRWFLPISEASWADEDGGTSGIWDSDVSAQVLYDAVKEQGYEKDDFRLFVATGTEDEAFEISTNQMISLLEYADLFKPGENTSCSMMMGGTHTITAVYTYLYHILPALFVQ